MVCLCSQSFKPRILDCSTCVTSLRAVPSVYVGFLTELGWRRSQTSISEVLISHRALLVPFWLLAILLSVRITRDSMEGWAGKQIQNIDLCRSPLLQHPSPCEWANSVSWAHSAVSSLSLDAVVQLPSCI